MPTTGPTVSQINGQSTQGGEIQFHLVDVNDHVIKILNSQPAPSLYALFGNDGLPPEPTISVGDSVGILIWEAGGNGLFSQAETFGSIPGTGGMSAGSHPATIPDQIVGRDGKISIPFYGMEQAAGLTPFALQNNIKRHLQGKAVDPQILVNISGSLANAVTIIGDVNHGALVPLSVHGERLLDIVAAAGGSSAPDYATYVKLTRHGITATVPMIQLVDDPAENIYSWPGDTITLVHHSKVFETFGATTANAEIPFNAEQISLAQALAKSSGLNDLLADPAGVFLIRSEPASLVDILNGKTPQFGETGTVPVVYHLDLSNLKSYFLAQQFPVEDKDIVYAANASSNSVQKFFILLGTLTNPILTGVAIKNTTSP